MNDGDPWMHTLPLAPANRARFVLALNELIVVCDEVEHIYRRAAAAPGVADFRSVFLIYASQRCHFADERRVEVPRLCGRACAFGLTTHSQLDLPGWLDGSDPLAVFVACAAAEEFSERAYFTALANPLPPAAKTLLACQLEEACVAHRHVRMVRAVMQERQQQTQA
jgi:hypothetical protein